MELHIGCLVHVAILFKCPIPISPFPAFPQTNNSLSVVKRNILRSVATNFLTITFLSVVADMGKLVSMREGTTLKLVPNSYHSPFEHSTMVLLEPQRIDCAGEVQWGMFTSTGVSVLPFERNPQLFCFPNA